MTEEHAATPEATAPAGNPPTALQAIQVLATAPARWALRRRTHPNRLVVYGQYVAAVLLYLAALLVLWMAFVGFRTTLSGRNSAVPAASSTTVVNGYTLDQLEQAFIANSEPFTRLVEKHPSLKGPQLWTYSGLKVETIQLMDVGRGELSNFTVAGRAVKLGFAKSKQGEIMVWRSNGTGQAVGNASPVADGDGTELGFVFFEESGQQAMGLPGGSIYFVHPK